MKKFRKIMAVLVAAMMIMAMCVPAWAESGRLEGTLVTDHAKITIDNPKYMETYSLYRLFELASFNDTNPATGNHTNEQYSYVIKETASNVNSWFTFLTTYGPNGLVNKTDSNPDNDVPYAVPSQSADAGSAYFTYSEEKVSVAGESDYHIIKGTDNFKYDRDDTAAGTNRADAGGTFGPDYTDGTAPTATTSNKVVQDFAQEALKYATQKALPTVVTPVRYEETNGSPLILLDNDATGDTTPKNLGYYLIGSSMGTLAALDTTNNEVTVHEKNDEPTITKAVWDDDASEWKRNTDANIDDLVQFKVVITAEQGVKNYVLHDVMEKGLSLVNTEDNPLEVKLKRTEKVDNPDYVDAETTPDEEPKIDAEVIYDIEAAPDKVAILGGLTNQTRTNYVLDTDQSNGCDFEITFKDADGLDGLGAQTTGFGSDKVTFLVKPDGKTVYEYIDIKDGNEIVVTYWARVTSDATIFGTNETQTGNSTTIAYFDGTNLDSTLQVHRDKEADAEGIQRNDNYTILTYGNHSHATPVRASVTTYQFEVAKTKDDEDASTHLWSLLGGAEFSLYSVSVTGGGAEDPSVDFTINNVKYHKEITNALKFTSTTNANDISYKFAGETATEELASAPALDSTQKIISVDNKKININGLKAGTYILQEDVAPTGYDKLAHPLVITITDRANNANVTAETNEGKILITGKNNNGTVINSTNALTAWNASIDTTGTTKYDTSEGKGGGLQVINTTTTELPSTGGMGTTVLYIVGGMLVILAGAYLFLSRKKTA